jgi:hypothetical protein
MIIGDRVDKIDASINERKEHEGMNVSINITDVKDLGQGLIEYHYIYTVEYKGVGSMTLRGVLIGRDEPEEVLKEWNKNKKLSKEQMERLLNIINYIGSVHGTLVARVLNYRPPILPPRIKVE